LLTMFARHAIDGSAPMALMDANDPGAGKGLLVDIIALMFAGRRFDATPFPDELAEQRKTVSALLSTAPSAVFFDNITGRIGGDAIELALTSNSPAGRMLGTNSILRTPNRAVWFATANNAQISADMIRRTMYVRLVRAPEGRAFKHGDADGLRAHVLARRGELACAALTILRAWFVAGRPPQDVKPWDSFEEWARVVRDPIVWLGLPDPARAHEQLKSNDAETSALRDLVHGLQEIAKKYQGRCTAAQVLHELHVNDTQHLALLGALAAFARSRGPLTTVDVGRALGRGRDRPIDGLRIVRDGVVHHATRWRVEETSAQAQAGVATPRPDESEQPFSAATEGGRADNESEASHAG